ncbi:hypothetical protein ACWDO0_28400 [Nocardia rhamnosiphila]
MNILPASGQPRASPLRRYERPLAERRLWDVGLSGTRPRNLHAARPRLVPRNKLRETSADAWIDSLRQPWQARFIGSLTDEELEGLKANAVQDAAE